MKKAAAIVTNRGGRTCHAAIVSRELGLPAIVGTENATERLEDGQPVTVSCAEGETGFVYQDNLKFDIQRTNLRELPRPRTKVMMNVGNPEEAFRLSFMPNDGVGLGAEKNLSSPPTLRSIRWLCWNSVGWRTARWKRRLSKSLPVTRTKLSSSWRSWPRALR